MGRLYIKAETAGARERVLRRWPAVQVLATAGVAADHYERGTFWPKLASIAKITADPEFQTEWGEAFLHNLRKLGLPTFESEQDAGTKYVGRILLHAGMPTYCLRDYFRILAWKRGSTPGLTPEDFISWAAGRAAGTGFTNVDMPVQRFIRYGDEFAVDVADRSFELLDAVASGWSVDEHLLPRRYWAVAQKFHDERGIDRPAESLTSHAPRSSIRPRLVLDPYGQGLLLRLPPVGEAPDGRAVWLVTLDEESQRVSTESLEPGSTEPAPQTDVAIGKPVRSASVALADHEDLQFPLIVVDDRDPLLAFGDDGELIPRGLPLPAHTAWLLFPGDRDALRVSGSFQIIAESPLPPRWDGFCLLQVDLTDAVSIAVGGSVRTVRKFEAARIDLAVPVRGVRTTSGVPVVAELPGILLPGNMAEADWEVTLHDASGVVLARHRLTEFAEPNALWKLVPRPLVGSYSVRIRGPWGRGASRAFTVVEGLSATFTPIWRRFVQQGLQPATAEVRAGAGVGLSHNRLEFDEHQRSQVVRATSQGRCCSLVVTPPHMTVSYQSSEFSINPSIRPLSLSCEEVRERPGELVLDVGVVADPALHVIANGRSIQTLSPKSGRIGVYRFNLAEIADTLGEYPHVSLALSGKGELVIAIVRPRTLFNGIRIEGDCLILENCAAVDDLNAYLFAVRAPWREPACVPVVDGRVHLPSWLVNAGPIYVMARIDDPWVQLPVPDWPRPGKATFVEAEGWLNDGTPEEIAISRFLAGDYSQPVEVIDFERLWTVRALLPALSLGQRIREVEEAIDTEVYANPAAALAALSGSETPSEAIPSLMIRSGLAWANLADAHGSTPPPWTLRAALPAALLSAADSMWSDEEVEAAVGICGDAVIGLLDGSDPYANAGRLDESAELLDRDPGLRQQFIRAAHLVPQGLLSESSRILAVMDFVLERRNPKLEWLVTHAHNVLREGETLIGKIGDPSAQKAIDARRHHTKERGWRVIPAVSMTLALAARYASRGHVPATNWVLREKRAWAELAEVVPQLVTIDLIIAELIIGQRLEEEAGKRNDNQY
ncbi:hypothetical protein [Mycolicibacterium smegmatis]|nr:hypothetical protein [Mycolicibacterium smegmatis]MCC3334396.1 hypothetical protein [Mycolicibacterium smegmatis]MCO4197865.1 hypothetical protein [Mycolicibacterium smegmatis]UUR99525.1 hypothetical protein NQ424_06180 [Mycolicibacterium smegmatis]UUS06080.1 hypothetical protein NQ426_06180 [Mycolicibacterium smegmatis]UUS12635.1 hypothetical protein NQ427_06180 [Mycolicibacterium smegmatis]